MKVVVWVFLVGLVVLVLTNPGPERYQEFVEEVVAGVIAAEAADVPGAGIIARMGGTLGGRLARNHSTRSNLVVASVYTLDMGAVGLRNEEWRFLGIGGHFLELSRPESLR